jgi:hypothetical protein
MLSDSGCYQFLPVKASDRSSDGGGSYTTWFEPERKGPCGSGDENSVADGDGAVLSMKITPGGRCDRESCWIGVRGADLWRQWPLPSSIRYGG